MSAIPANWQRPFFTLWIGQAISLFGSALVQFALVWWITQKTGSATMLAFATLIAVLPNVLLGPIAGAVVDRHNRRWLMLISDSGVMLATLVLAGLFWLGWAQVWHVYVILLARAIAGTFQFPAMQASTALMVPEEHLARVAGLNQMLNGGLGIVAPPVGALLLSTLPMQSVLAVDVGTALFGILPLLVLTIPQPPRKAAPPDAAPASLWDDLRAGFRYVRAWQGLLLLMGLASIINFLLTPASSLLPILVIKHFRGDALNMATLESTFGIGMLVGGLTLGVWGGFKRRMATSFMGIIGIGLAFFALGLLPPTGFVLALGCAFVAAVMQVFANGSLFAVAQKVVAPDMQGRVFTLLGSVASAMSPLSLLVAGPIADALGVQTWYLIGGAVCAAIGVGCYFVPAIYTLEEQGAAVAAEHTAAQQASASPELGVL